MIDDHAGHGEYACFFNDCTQAREKRAIKSCADPEEMLRFYGIEFTGGWSLLAQQACIPADMDPNEAARLAELYSPSGTSFGWHFKDEPLPNGDSPIVECSDNPKRRHVILWA